MSLSVEQAALIAGILGRLKTVQEHMKHGELVEASDRLDSLAEDLKDRPLDECLAAFTLTVSQPEVDADHREERRVDDMTVSPDELLNESRR